MTDVFIITLKPVLIICKFLGIINISYYLESNGLLTKNTNSTYYSLFEFTKTVVLMIFTYNFHKVLIFTEVLFLYKFWAVIIVSRLSETWIIKLINGIIEFDQKLISLPIYLKASQTPFSKHSWNVIFLCTFLYYIGTTLLAVYTWPIQIIDIHSVLAYLIRVSFFIDFIVIISSFFFLRNLEYRFETLIDFWKRLPAGLMAVPGECSNYDVTIMVDNIRLLHTELSDILRIFSLGYGQMLLVYFVFSYIEMLVIFFYTICFKIPITNDQSMVKSILQKVLPHISNVQNVIFTMIIVVSASRVNEKVKMFMNQISVFESQEMSAYGIFNINLNLVITIIVLLISGIATLIQMKEHPLLLQTVNSTKYVFHKNDLS